MDVLDSMTDWRGIPIRKDSTVIYAVSIGSSGAFLRTATVVGLRPKEESKAWGAEDKVRLRVTGANKGDHRPQREVLVGPKMLTVVRLP